MTMRVGLGFDVHSLGDGPPLILGGVTIPYHAGLIGHSDGDVLTHAVIDALLGSVALGDIGTHFPSGDPQYRDARSLLLLTSSVETLRLSRWQLMNLDATIVAERPHLEPYMFEIRQSLASVLHVEIGAVSVKATTTDGIGSIGNGEGIAAHAVVTVEAIR